MKQNNHIKDLSIAKRVGIALMLISIPLVIMFSVFTFFKETESVQVNIHKKFNDSLTLLGRNLGFALTSNDVKAIELMIHSMIEAQRDTFVGVEVYDNAGKRFAKAENVAFKNLSGDLKVEEFKIYGSSSELVGKLRIKYSEDHLMNQMYSKLTFVLLGLSIVFIIFLLSIWGILHYFIELPMARLLASLNQAKESDYQGTLAVNYSGEIEKLAIAFNDTMRAVRIREIALKNHLHSLEKEIEKRTGATDHVRVQQMHASRMNTLAESGNGLAHEINNPITIISGAVRLIRKALAGTKLQPDPTGHLDKIQNGVDRIARIVKLMRSVGRNGSEDAFENVPINDIFEDIKILTYAKLNSQGILIKTTVHPSDLTACIRKVQITQILQGFVENSASAIRGMPEQWISIEAVEDDGDVLLSVTDSGPGIPEAVRKNLFKPFFSTKNDGKGSDFGLAYAKSVVEAHGGKIWYDASSSNTRFVISIPVANLKK